VRYLLELKGYKLEVRVEINGPEALIVGLSAAICASCLQGSYSTRIRVYINAIVGKCRIESIW